MINGISHITLIVRDLEKSSHLLKYIFQAKEIYNIENKNLLKSKTKYFLITDIWIALIKGDPHLEKTYNHIAFQISQNDIKEYLKKINELGLVRIKDRKRIDGEGESIYFYDYDNHLFELHTGFLNQRLEVYNQDY